MSFSNAPSQQTHVPYQTPKSPVAGVRASQVYVQRRPSGARAPPAKKVISAASADLRSVQEDHYTQPSSSSYNQQLESSTRTAVRNEMDDYGADAIAALSLAEHIGQPGQPDLLPPAPIGSRQENIDRAGSPAYPSSFAASKAATDRKAKAQAQQAAAQAAATKPGRGGKSKGRKPKTQGAWGGDEDDEEEEEEEEEEDDDDDADSDGPSVGRSSRLPYNNLPPSASQHLYDPRRGTPPDPRRGTPPTGRPLPSPDYQSQQRGGRGLPVVPGGRSPSGSIPRGQEDYRRTQYDDMGGREEPQQQQQRGRDLPPQLRQTIWSQALPDPHNPNPSGPGRDTFVKVEDQAEQISKVFAPQGLLGAGLQDKHDRSAKRQEEIARESGTSLINVPNKPLDPQTGLLGAVTALERDRKHDGGMGATLTRKLADERVAEERQRKLDELQRQQLEGMTNGGGSVYDMHGGQYPNPMSQFGGYNPMMMNPMMMNPMMGNPMMGMGMGMGGMTPGMGGMGHMGMGGMTQQQMMMAQAAAAEAYQRAMMTFSQAGSVPGSQAASEAGDASPGPGSRLGATSPFPNQMGMLSPMMTGMSANPMFMNPMMMGGMGGMGMMGGMQPGMMPGTPGMYSQQYSHSQVPTPSSDQQHYPPGRMSGFNDTLANDRSAAHSQQSHRDSPPAGRPGPN